MVGSMLRFRLNPQDQARLTRVQADLGHQSEADTFLQCMRMIDEIMERSAGHCPIEGRRGLCTVITIYGTNGQQKCMLGGLNGG